MAQPHDAGPVYVSEYDYPVKLTFAGQLFVLHFVCTYMSDVYIISMNVNQNNYIG